MYTRIEKYLNLRCAYDDRISTCRRRVGCAADKLLFAKGIAHFVERHRINHMIVEEDISSLMVVTDRDEASDVKIRNQINDSLFDILKRQ